MVNQRFVIEGGHPIGGRIRPSGNKNAALPLIAATLLTDDEVVLTNVPAIRDVEALISILRDLGVTVTPRGQARSPSGPPRQRLKPNPEGCKPSRASILLAGPLLARRGHVRLPLPGGDVIGRRRIDTHVLALEALGGTVETGSGQYVFSAPKQLVGADVFLDEASVTGTENAVMAAALALGDGGQEKPASACQDLCRLINAMGLARSTAPTVIPRPASIAPVCARGRLSVGSADHAGRGQRRQALIGGAAAGHRARDSR